MTQSLAMSECGMTASTLPPSAPRQCFVCPTEIPSRTMIDPKMISGLLGWLCWQYCLMKRWIGTMTWDNIRLREMLYSPGWALCWMLSVFQSILFRHWAVCLRKLKVPAQRCMSYLTSSRELRILWISNRSWITSTWTTGTMEISTKRRMIPQFLPRIPKLMPIASRTVSRFSMESEVPHSRPSKPISLPWEVPQGAQTLCRVALSQSRWILIWTQLGRATAVGIIILHRSRVAIIIVVKIWNTWIWVRVVVMAVAAMGTNKRCHSMRTWGELIMRVGMLPRVVLMSWVRSRMVDPMGVKVWETNLHWTMFSIERSFKA